jgi:outer membrane protein insertion porin family
MKGIVSPHNDCAHRWTVLVGLASAVLGLMVGGCRAPWTGLGRETISPPLATIEPVSRTVRRQPVPTGEPRAGDEQVALASATMPAEPPPSDTVNPAGVPVPPADAPPANPSQIVADVRVTGNRNVPTHHILRQIRTRPGRYFDPDLLQQDVDSLWRMPAIRRVEGPYVEPTAEGIVITFGVVERPVIESIRFVGNREISERTLLRETGLEEGQPLDQHAVRLATQRIEELYHEKGFPRTEVELAQGLDSDDHNVVFVVYEDARQRIYDVDFEGNTIASDGRLKSLIKTKPGMFFLFGGQLQRQQIEEDILRLTTYYRGLGFFNARVGRQIEEHSSGWTQVRFIIDEGPRYRVRSVSFVGNKTFTTDQLQSLVKLQPADGVLPEFNAAKMNQDAVALRDLYGSQGYVFCDVQAEPRFLETPGVLDLVYQIEEGKQYRVGEIHVRIDGDYGVTKREVVLNRLGMRPGDLIDARKLRQAEGRLRRSQLFADGTAGTGEAPRVSVRPPELEELEQHARRR